MAKIIGTRYIDALDGREYEVIAYFDLTDHYIAETVDEVPEAGTWIDLQGNMTYFPGKIRREIHTDYLELCAKVTK